MYLLDEWNSHGIFVIFTISGFYKPEDRKDDDQNSNGKKYKDSDENDGQNTSHHVGDDHSELEVQRTFHVSVYKVTALFEYKPNNQRGNKTTDDS